MRVNRLAAVAAGAVVLVAVSPPVDGAADANLTAHMVQHLALLVVAAPLAALGLPGLRPPAGRWVWWASAAVIVHSVVLLGWHAPPLYDAAQRALPVHGVEHLSYLAAGWALWAAVLPRPGRRPSGAAVLAVFLAGLPCTLLGAALATAASPWYAAYSGAGALADQEMAGVVMWGFGGLAYLAGGIAVFAVGLAATGRPAVVTAVDPPAPVGPPPLLRPVRPSPPGRG